MRALEGSASRSIYVLLHAETEQLSEDIMPHPADDIARRHEEDDEDDVIEPRETARLTYNTRRSLPIKIEEPDEDVDLQSNPYSRVRLWKNPGKRQRQERLNLQIQGQGGQEQSQDNQLQLQSRGGKRNGQSRQASGQSAQGQSQNGQMHDQSVLVQGQGSEGQFQNGQMQDHQAAHAGVVTVNEIPANDALKEAYVADETVPTAVDLRVQSTVAKESVTTPGYDNHGYGNCSKLPPGPANQEFLGGPAAHMYARRYAASYANSEGTYDVACGGDYYDDSYAWSSIQQFNWTRKNKDAHISKEIKNLKNAIYNLKKESKKNSHKGGSNPSNSATAPYAAPSVTHAHQSATATSTAAVTSTLMPNFFEATLGTPNNLQALQAIAAAVTPAAVPMQNHWQAPQPQSTTSAAPIQNYYQLPQPTIPAAVQAPSQSYWHAAQPATPATAQANWQILQAVAPNSAQAPVQLPASWQYAQPPVFNAPGQLAQASAAAQIQLMGENYYNLLNNLFRNNQR